MTGVQTCALPICSFSWAGSSTRHRGCSTPPSQPLLALAAAISFHHHVQQQKSAIKRDFTGGSKKQNYSSKKSSWFQQKCVNADGCKQNNLAGSSKLFAGCSKTTSRCQQNDSTVVRFQHRSCVDVAFFYHFQQKHLPFAAPEGLRLHRRRLLVAAFCRSGSSQKTHPFQPKKLTR